MTWNPLYGPLTYLALAAGLVIALMLVRRLGKSPSLVRWIFVIPRAAVLSLLVLILLNPVREAPRQLPPRRAHVTCLIDASRSMGLDRPESRLEQVKQVVYDTQAGAGDRAAAELQLYRFGSSFSSVPSLSELRPNQDDSDLAAALKRATAFFQSDPAQAVVVFSDGTLPDREQLRELAAVYRGLDIPVHVFPCGNDQIRGDIAISQLSVPRGAKAGDQVPVRVAVRSQGYDGQRVELAVRSATGSLDERPLQSLPITLDGTTQSFDVVVPADLQAGTLEISVALQEGEAIESNNRVPFELLAQERNLRVFYMEGTVQNREWRWVRDALQEDPRIECVPVTVDSQYTQRPRLMRIDDPYRGFPATRKELFEYDVVICSDISIGAFTREQLDWTVELVSERGGGFVMVGGHTAFGAGGWDQTQWDQLIPLDIRGGQVGRSFVNQSFRVSVPASARSHPIWRLSEDAAENQMILSRMPPFYGTNVAQRLKPAATLLGESSTPLTVVGACPIFSCQSYGRGRTFAMLTDTTEAWGTAFERQWGEGDNRYFRKFWRNVIYWLTENSVSGRHRLIVDTDKLIYRPGEPIQLRVRAYDDAFAETTAYRVEASLVEMAPSSETDLKAQGTTYQGQIPAGLPEEDSNEEASTLAKSIVEVRAWDGSRLVATEQVELQVLNDSDELLDPQPNPKLLAELAELTGGEVLTGRADLTRILDALPSVPGASRPSASGLGSSLDMALTARLAESGMGAAAPIGLWRLVCDRLRAWTELLIRDPPPGLPLCATRLPPEFMWVNGSRRCLPTRRRRLWCEA